METGISAMTGGTSITTIPMWSMPTFLEVNEVGESIEMIYKETSLITYTGLVFNQPPQERVFKIVYSCKNFQWHKSERIYGKVIPASEESYEFKD